MTWDSDDTKSSDPLADLPTDRLERAMAFRNGLISMCEGWAKMDRNVYSVLRREFMEDPITAPLVPPFVKKAQDRGAMWASMKDFDGQWKPRRRMVRKEFAPFIDALESGPAMADTLISEGIASFDALGVKAAWDRALSGRETDPAAAITAARTLLETVCKHLIEDADGTPGYGQNDDLPKLYRVASERRSFATL